MASSCDDLKANIASKMSAYFEKVIANFPSTPTTCFVADIFVAGWSDKSGRADAYLITSHNQHAEIPPWTVVDLPQGILTPPIGSGWDDWMMGHYDPLSLMPAILVEQRKALKATLGGDLPYVGGYAMAATVSRRSITTQVIGQWPDRDGAVLDPGCTVR